MKKDKSALKSEFARAGRERSSETRMWSIFWPHVEGMPSRLTLEQEQLIYPLIDRIEELEKENKSARAGFVFIEKEQPRIIRKWSAFWPSGVNDMPNELTEDQMKLVKPLINRILELEKNVSDDQVMGRVERKGQPEPVIHNYTGTDPLSAPLEVLRLKSRNPIFRFFERILFNFWESARRESASHGPLETGGEKNTELEFDFPGADPRAENTGLEFDFMTPGSDDITDKQAEEMRVRAKDASGHLEYDSADRIPIPMQATGFHNINY